MNTELRYPYQYKKVIVFLAAMSILFGALTALIGELAMPVASAFIAGLLLFEKKKILSSVACVAVVAFNFAVDLALGGKFTLVGIETAVVAILIFFMFYKQRSKAECVIAVTVVVSIFNFSGFLLEACYATGQFNWDAITAYYGEFYDEIQDLLIEQVNKATSSLVSSGDNTTVLISESDIIMLLDSIVAIIPSLIVVAAFALSGFAFKIFRAIIFKYSVDRLPILRWRFRATNVIAYFYFVLLFLGLVAGGATDTVAIVISNLYNIFLYVFAYIGTVYVFNIIANFRSRGLAIGIIAVALVMLSTLAITILSIFGAVLTIKENGLLNSKNDNSQL